MITLGVLCVILVGVSLGVGWEEVKDGDVRLSYPFSNGRVAGHFTPT